MKFKLSNSTPSPEPQSSSSIDQPMSQAHPKKPFGKKLYLSVIAIAVIIIIIVAAVFVVPQTSANTIPLNVNYTVGEQLTYDITASVSLGSTSTSSTSVTANSTLLVDVVSLKGQTYTLNYSTTTSVAGYSTTNSQIINVTKTNMISFLGLLPVILQAEATNADTSTSPIFSASIDQSTAKVGDTWQIPLNSTDPSDGNLTLTFAAIQDLTTQAGTFKVFRIDYSASGSQNDNTQLNEAYTVSGSSYLEYNSCKQIQSSIQLGVTGSLLSGTSISATCTLVRTPNLKPTGKIFLFPFLHKKTKHLTSKQICISPFFGFYARYQGNI